MQFFSYLCTLILYSAAKVGKNLQMRKFLQIKD